MSEHEITVAAFTEGILLTCSCGWVQELDSAISLDELNSVAERHVQV